MTSLDTPVDSLEAAQLVYDEVDVMDLLTRKFSSTVLIELAELAKEAHEPAKEAHEPPSTPFDFLHESSSRALHRPCAACRTAKVRCDYQQPCSRCVRLGIGHLCAPPPDVKRGRPPRKDKSGQISDAARGLAAEPISGGAAPAPAGAEVTMPSEQTPPPASMAVHGTVEAPARMQRRPSASCSPRGATAGRSQRRRSWHREPACAAARSTHRPGDVLARKSSIDDIDNADLGFAAELGEAARLHVTQANRMRVA